MLLFLFTEPARAWNNVGHRTIAELAWRKMNPSERAAASDLLRHHPHYKEYLAAAVPSGVDTNEWVFLTAAVWPDWTRPAKPGQPHKGKSITKYNLYPHGIGYPFLAKGDTNRALLENFYIAKPDAEMVLSNSIALLGNKAASAHDRAVSLAWTLHLMGDLHQPLHTASLVSAKYPNEGSLGGNNIVLDGNGKQISLHAFWDQLPGVNPSYQSIAALADLLTTMPELEPKALPEYRTNQTIASWVQEGFRTAATFAYQDGHIASIRPELLKSGKISPTDVPKLKPEYIAEAQTIARRRLVLAGQRLVDRLQGVW